MVNGNIGSIITRCPKCSTAFRVTDKQLEVAKGAVRCGYCLNVFRATDHKETETKQSQAEAKQSQTKAVTKPTPKTDVVELSRAIKRKLAEKHGLVAPDNKDEKPARQQDKEQAQSPVKSASPQKKTKQPQKISKKITFDVVDETKIQDNESDKSIEQNSDDFYFFDKEPSEANPKTSIFGNPTLKPVTESSQEKADESWALDMLADLENDDDIQPIQVKKRHNKAIQKKQTASVEDFKLETLTATEPPIDLDLDAEPDSLGEDMHLDGDIKKPKKKKQKQSLFSKLSFNKAKVNKKKVTPSVKQNPLPEEPDAKKANSNKTEHEKDLTFFFDESFDQTESSSTDPLDLIEDANIEHIDAQPLVSDTEIDDAINSSPSYKSEVQGFIDGIQGVPVEMEYYDSSSAGRWLWKLLLVLLLVILCVQLISFRFESLSKHPGYRPYLLSLCEKVGCSVAPLAEPEKVRASNLVIRNHPNIPKTLLVDVILINGSKSDQVYPTLLLEFSDINNRVLTQNQITPSEYLRGELAGAKSMPSQQPIQISITIEDPGNGATNYQLYPIRDGA